MQLYIREYYEWAQWISLYIWNIREIEVEIFTKSPLVTDISNCIYVFEIN